MTTPLSSPDHAEHETADPDTAIPGAAYSRPPLPRPRIPLPESWRADWITAPSLSQVPGSTETSAPLFRRAWDLPSAAMRATLHLSGLGTALAWVNGSPANDQRLAPGLCDYSVAARAVSWDVSRHVLGSRRVSLAVEMGRGFFDLHTPEVWMWSTAPWRATPRLTAELHVTCEDGSTQVLMSDGSWRCGTGGLRFDSLYEGETWDEAAEPHGWRDPDFEDAAWPSAEAVTPDPALSAVLPRPRAAREVATSWLPLREAMTEPILVQERIRPTWTALGDGRFVGDVGRVIAGWTRLEPLDDVRREITVIHGERLAADGSVIAENSFIPTGRFQRDDVALEGRPVESHHGYKGFRYLEVRGAQPGTDLEVIAQAAWADVPLVGGTDSSDPTLSWLERAFVATVRANLHWVLTDTPTYEKNGWTGDAQVALPALLTRFDLRAFLTSWLDDMLDAQRADGSLPVIVPSAGWGYGDGQCAPAPEWTTLYPVLVAALEGEYGLDLWPIHGEAVERYLDFELGRLDADGLAEGILGDYLAPGREGPPPEDIRLESSLLLRRALVVTADSGRSAHADRFRAAADSLAEQALRVFFDAEHSTVASRPLRGSRAPADADPGFRQAPQILALDAGIVPPDHVSAVVGHLVEDIRSRGGHHDAGCLGMARLCSVLVRAGRPDVALEVATNPTAPSWESWRQSGHRTLLEMWTDPVRSRAHYFMGAGIDVLARDLVGLERTSPHWRRFRVAPTLVPGLADISASHGGIHAGWSWADGSDGTTGTGGAVLRVSVPEGSIADVVLPDGRVAEVGPGEHTWEL
ncbi:family 78 glycoside hydrolase catalytic domain [Brachybacterium endophyticum]|uniref:family 78 glycoside hydrolase catalytic domain n=1 Tax=Brachybacterium endophyticum TaxID=2182385 RepID=UPI0010579170|nr:family 78 glycoside hydrolase catalytic domain [Brachybacterium endophyticum]